MKSAIATLLLSMLITPASLAEAPEPETPTETIGTTVVGDQEAPLGLFLAPWKGSSRSEVGLVPGLHDAPVETINAEGFARSARYYSVGRAYRAERLMRNH